MTLNQRALQHFVRRGLDMTPGAREHITEHFLGNNDTPPEKLSTQELLVLCITPLLFYLSFVLMQFTLFNVLPSLVMIEQPSTIVVTETYSDAAEPDSPLEKAPLLDEEIVVIRQEPVTRSIRGAVAYLASIGGARARYRGFWMSVAYHLAHGAVMHGLLLVASLMPFAQPVMTFVCHMGATVLLCRLHMTWTHIVVSNPSPLPWFKRIVRGSHVVKSLALPSLKLAVAHQLLIILPAITFFTWGPIPEGPALRNDLIYRGLAVLGTALLVACFVLLPASVHLTRIEASLLPEDVETIVPFDRTFGGRVAPDSKWSVRYLTAMASLTTPDRIRIVKYYAKAIAMLTIMLASAAMCIKLQVDAFGIDRIRATLEDLVQQVESQGQPTVNLVRRSVSLL